MGERKVQSKYYPPDFDPSKLPRIQKKKTNDDAVRFMLPMSVCCKTCGEYMGTGLKFNARKSNTGEDYLGIKIFRFTMRCKGCPAAFAIRTDPKNSDYACESGVRRNFEPWRQEEKEKKDAKEEREKQDEDAVQALENRTLDAKAQMDDLDDLQAILTENAKRAKLGADHLRKSREDSQKQQEEELNEQADILLERAKLKASSAQTQESSQSASERAKFISTKSNGDKEKKGSLLKGTSIKVKIKKKVPKRPSEAEPSKRLQKKQVREPEENGVDGLNSSKDVATKESRTAGQASRSIRETPVAPAVPSSEDPPEPQPAGPLAYPSSDEESS